MNIQIKKLKMKLNFIFILYFILSYFKIKIIKTKIKINLILLNYW